MTRRDGWRLIAHTLGEQRLGVFLGVSVGLLWTAGKVMVPWLVGQAIDNGIQAADRDAALRWALAIGLAGVLAATFTGMRRWYAFRESRRAELRLRDRLFAHLQSLHMGYHDQAQTGDLMSRANTDLQQINGLIVLIPLTISNAVTVLAVTVVLVLIDPLLALLALGALPLLNVLAKMFSTRLHPWMLTLAQESAALAAVVEESVVGVRVVKGFGAQDVQAARLRKEADDVYDAGMAAARVRARYLPALDLLPNLGLLLVLLVGGQAVIDERITLGALVTFNVYVVLLIWPLRMLGMIIAQAQRAVTAAQRVHEVLATAPHIVDDPHAAPLPTQPTTGTTGLGDVRFENVTFSYAPGRTAAVLEGLDLHLAAGESVALVGATGSGKTTVARLLPRFYDVQEGRVLLDGHDVRGLRVQELRSAVGFVFEDTFLFNDTIAANIAFADPDAAQADIERAAKLAGAHEFITALADGYGTEIGERGFSLSGGQRQRIAIARAILADPRVLILDDATSSVDPTKEHEIRDALATVLAGRTTIVIAHRPATIELADRVVLIDDGRVAASGTHEELLATNARYREILASATDADARDAVSSHDGIGAAGVDQR